jgi:hypothetical protein
MGWGYAVLILVIFSYAIHLRNEVDEAAWLEEGVKREALIKYTETREACENPRLRPNFERDCLRHEITFRDVNFTRPWYNTYERIWAREWKHIEPIVMPFVQMGNSTLNAINEGLLLVRTTFSFADKSLDEAKKWMAIMGPFAVLMILVKGMEWAYGRCCGGVRSDKALPPPPPVVVYSSPPPLPLQPSHPPSLQPLLNLPAPTPSFVPLPKASPPTIEWIEDEPEPAPTSSYSMPSESPFSTRGWLPPAPPPQDRATNEWAVARQRFAGMAPASNPTLVWKSSARV